MYTWVDLGSSFVPSDLLAAFLYAQLEARASIESKLRDLWRYYFEELRGWAADRNVGLPAVPSHCEGANLLFYLFLPDAEARRRLIAHLRERGIQSVFHYQPLHLSAMGRKAGGRQGNCPVAESAGERLLRLPFYTGMDEAERACVVEAVKEFTPDDRSVFPVAMEEVLPTSDRPHDKHRGRAGAALRIPKRVAIVQSSYIPWKGYFDQPPSTSRHPTSRSSTGGQRHPRRRRQASSSWSSSTMGPRMGAWRPPWRSIGATGACGWSTSLGTSVTTKP